MFATNLEGGSVLGIDTVRSVDEVPDGEADLVFVCTPAAANVALLKSCAARGVRAAFVTSAGYAEAGGDGEACAARARRRGRGRGHLARGAERAGARVHSGASSARRSSPHTLPRAHRPREPERQPRLGVDEHGRGESGSGSAAHIGRERRDGVRRRLPRVVRRGRRDRGRPRLRRRDRRWPRASSNDAASRESKPVVLREGRGDRGRPAAPRRTPARSRATIGSSTGTCRQAGCDAQRLIEEAFEAAATFATQPLPKGTNTAVVTTAVDGA